MMYIYLRTGLVSLQQMWMPGKTLLQFGIFFSWKQLLNIFFYRKMFKILLKMTFSLTNQVFTAASFELN